MTLLTCADVIESLAGVRPPHATQVITQAVVDARKAIPSSLFVVLPRMTADTPAAVSQAFERGAALALIQQDPPDSARTLNLQDTSQLAALSNQDLPLCLRVPDALEALHKIVIHWRQQLQNVTTIAVTGTVGKTTTKDLVAEVLQQRYRTLKNAGNLRSEIDIPLALTELSDGHHRAVLEIDLPGRIDYFAQMAAPKTGIVTNVGAIHTREASSQAEIAHRMAEFVKILPPDGYAILNYDDPWVREMAAQTRANVLYYGLSPQADIWADEVEGRGLEGVHFRLHFGEEIIYLRVPLIGRHSVHTALRAAAVGLVEGFTWQEIVQGLRFGNTQLRLVAVRSVHGALLLDDTYNASTESALAALNLLDEMEGRKVAVLGGLPGLSQYRYPGHHLVGLRAAQVVDLLITVGAPAQEIAAAARMAWMPASAIVELDNVDQVIAFLDENLRPDDVVLIKGPARLQMGRITAALEEDQ